MCYEDVNFGVSRQELLPMLACHIITCKLSRWHQQQSRFLLCDMMITVLASSSAWIPHAHLPFSTELGRPGATKDAIPRHLLDAVMKHRRMLQRNTRLARRRCQLLCRVSRPGCSSGETTCKMSLLACAGNRRLGIFNRYGCE